MPLEQVTRQAGAWAAQRADIGIPVRSNKPVVKSNIPFRQRVRVRPYPRDPIQQLNRSGQLSSNEPEETNNRGSIELNERTAEAARERNQEIRHRRPGGSSSASGNGATSASSGGGESNPLLPGRVATTTGIGIGKTAAIGGIIGAGVGAAISGSRKGKEDGDYTLPGSTYVGPGNKIHVDAPRHEADAVAKEHDLGYERFIEFAKTHPLTLDEFRSGVQKLDREAIDKFDKDFKETGSWHSLAGKYGLYIKDKAEDVFGPIYPTKPPGNAVAKYTSSGQT